MLWYHTSSFSFLFLFFQIPPFLSPALCPSVTPQIPRERHLFHVIHSTKISIFRVKMRRSFTALLVTLLLLVSSASAGEEVIEKGEEVVIKEDGKDNTGE